MLVLCCIAIASVLLPGSYGRSAGPPISTSDLSPVGGVTQYVRVCEEMTPGHLGTSPQTGNGGYYIVSDLIEFGGTYLAGETHQLQLRATINTFRGFLIQARDGSNYLGSFINLPAHTQTLACDSSNPMATVTHNNPARMEFASLTFTWQAPSGSDGSVSFLYSVVQDFDTYFVELDAKANLPPLILPPLPSVVPPVPSSVPPVPSVVSSSVPPVPSVVSSSVPPVPSVVSSSVPPVPSVVSSSVPLVPSVVSSSVPLVPSVVSSSVPPVPSVVSSSVPPVPSDIPTVPSATMPPLPAVTSAIPSIRMLPPTATPVVPSTTMPPPVLQPDPPSIPPEYYRLTNRIPAGCTPTVDCSYFVGIKTNKANSSYLDIYLEGESQGWVAVGFTETANMLSADVLGCNRMGQTEMVYVVDTWNVVNPPRRNVLDTNQDGVFTHSAEFVNGRISCNFSRLIGVVNLNQDLNLNGNYFLLFGRGGTGGGMGNFPNHLQPNPTISTSQVNPSTLTQDLNPTAPPATFVQPDPPNVPPEDYRLTNRIPAGCTPTVNCSYFVGIKTNKANSSYLDIYLEGESQGWVAVGFTETANMPSADVLGCNRMGQTEVVHVVDTWNAVNPPRRNQLDVNQVGVFAHSTEFADGRISCNFSRFIGVVNSNQDLNLNGNYFLLFGRGRIAGGMGNFPNHLMPNPTISASQVNPSTLTQDLNPTAPTATFEQPDPPNDPPEDYRLTNRIPTNCIPTVDCSYFVGIQTNRANNSYLDIYLEGKSQGWVAVGFTENRSMFNADVLGCNRMGQTEVVYVVDTWNVANPLRLNVLDTNQDGVYAHSTEFADGRISCNFSRFIEVVNPNQDLDLNGSYYLLFGRGETGGSMGNFPNHLLPNPTISTSQVNPAVDQGEVGVSEDIVKAILIRAHGILMIIAWPILAVTAIFFASWMKPALPKGEWFQVHRAFLLASMFIAAIGFVAIFVAFRDSRGLINLGTDNPFGTAHFGIGITVMALHILNPIIAAFRCKPKSKHRWIFNLFHASLIGLAAEILALVNVGLGLSIFSRGWSWFGDLIIFWVYLPYAIFLLVLTGVLLLVFTILTSTTNKAERGNDAPSCLKWLLSSPPENTENIELTATDTMEKPAINVPPPRKPPSRDARLRWIMLGVLLTVMLPSTVALIVLVAFPKYF